MCMGCAWANSCASDPSGEVFGREWHKEVGMYYVALLGVVVCGRVLFGSRVAKREAEGTVHTKHQRARARGAGAPYFTTNKTMSSWL